MQLPPPRRAAAFGAALLFFLIAFGCATGESASKPSPAASAPASPAPAAWVFQMAERWWAMLMERYPEWATLTGEHRYDDRLTETGPEARRRWQALLRGFLDEIEAGAARINSAKLSANDALTLELLRREVGVALEEERLGLATWHVDQMYGPQASLPYFVSAEHPMQTEDDVRNLIARYRALPAHLDGLIRDLEEGLAEGRTAPRIVVERVIGQLDDLLAASGEAWVFIQAQERIPGDLDDALRRELVAELSQAAKEAVRPAFERYRRFLKETYLENARTSVGLSEMPGGTEAYAFLVQKHTTTSLSPKEIHEVGLRKLERIEAKMRALAKERGHDGDAKSFLAALRSDPRSYAESREALLETFQAALRRADEALPRAFGRLPRLPYEVKPMDAAREKDAPAAYYQPGSPKDGRPGVFVANLYRFEERPIFNSDVLAFHEAVPGHHLQIALAQELEGLPRFRAKGGFTAFVEGWALYAERLADELGLYGSLEARVGYLGFAAWRASRLVVDTGLHALGWSRDKAIEFLAAHTTLGRVDVENEVDRYIAMPGQALAYMVGCLHILRLREHAREHLGEAFELERFHDALLSAGALPLDLLDAHASRALGIPPPPEG